MRKFRNSIGGTLGFIAGLMSITPQLLKDVGETMDGIYTYIPQWGWAIISVLIFVALWVWNTIEENKKSKSLSASSSLVNNEQNIDKGGYGFQGNVFNAPLTEDNSKVVDFSGSTFKDSEVKVTVEGKKKDNNDDAPIDRNLAYRMGQELSKYQRIMEEVSNYSVENGMQNKFKEANEKFYQIKDMFDSSGEAIFHNSEDVKYSLTSLHFARSKYGANLQRYIFLEGNNPFESPPSLEEVENHPYFVEKRDLAISLRAGEILSNVNERIKELRVLMKENT